TARMLQQTGNNCVRPFIIDINRVASFEQNNRLDMKPDASRYSRHGCRQANQARAQQEQVDQAETLDNPPDVFGKWTTATDDFCGVKRIAARQAIEIAIGILIVRKFVKAPLAVGMGR